MTPEAITRSLCEFIIVYMHAVSYVSNVYPREAYNLVRQYGTSTYQSAHPGVTMWIENAAKSIMQLIYGSKKGGRSIIISIVILENGVPLERFGIDLTKFEVNQTPASQSQPIEIAALDVSEQFKACLIRLYTSGETPKDETKDRSMSLIFEGDLMMPEIPNIWIKAKGTDQRTRRIRPIRTIELNANNQEVLVLNTFRQPAK